MDRLQTLREILSDAAASTQDEIREELERRKFSVTQSTVSRDLKRIGAIKTVDGEGRTVYRLGEDLANSTPVPMPVVNSMRELVTDIESNGMLIVIRTSPGSASLVARHIDSLLADQVLGTIAGDDTVFVAPTDVRKTAVTLFTLQKTLAPTEM